MCSEKEKGGSRFVNATFDFQKGVYQQRNLCVLHFFSGNLLYEIFDFLFENELLDDFSSRNALMEVKDVLELLDLSGNCLTRVPAENLRDSAKLMYLDLSDNKISTVGDFELTNLPVLKVRQFSAFISTAASLSGNSRGFRWSPLGTVF